jgi:transcription elongation GreA/GreB family factor
MSRAFVREGDGADEPLPELAVSTQPNFVTPTGLRQIEARVAALDAEQRAARAARDGGDKALLARIARDLRYWTQRRASARLVDVPNEPADVVRFGVTAMLRFDDGSERAFKLVGEDEADPANGLISWAAPLAKNLVGKVVGDKVVVLGRTAEIVRLMV